MSGDRITIHAMVPEDPKYWREQIRRFLKMSKENQLKVWRMKRRIIWADSDFDEYAVWTRYLLEATGETDIQKLIPQEILMEESLARNPHLGDDGAGIGDGENP